MKYVQVKQLKIGEGIPKICVPLVGVSQQEILQEAEAIKKLPADLVEWRADFFENVFDTDCVTKLLSKLSSILENMPILFTFRTAKEGGEKDIEEKDYIRLNEAAAKSGLADIIDVELFSGEKVVKELVKTAHENGVKVIASNHDFHKTPPKEEIVNRLLSMQELGADILKIAVMPEKEEDVITLLDATLEMKHKPDIQPVVTMSMSGIGTISRIAGQFSGSAITFGAAKKASAPGQIGVKELQEVLGILDSITNKP